MTKCGNGLYCISVLKNGMSNEFDRSMDDYFKGFQNELRNDPDESLEEKFEKYIALYGQRVDLSGLEQVRLCDYVLGELEVPEAFDGKLFGIAGEILGAFGLNEYKMLVNDNSYVFNADLIEIFILRFHLYLYFKAKKITSMVKVRDVLRVELEFINGRMSVADRVESLLNEDRVVKVEEVDIEAFMDDILGDFLEQK